MSQVQTPEHHMFIHSHISLLRADKITCRAHCSQLCGISVNDFTVPTRNMTHIHTHTLWVQMCIIYARLVNALPHIYENFSMYRFSTIQKLWGGKTVPFCLSICTCNKIIKSEWEYSYISSLISSILIQKRMKWEKKQIEKGAAGSFWKTPLQQSGRFAGELTETVKAVAMSTTITLVSEQWHHWCRHVSVHRTHQWHVCHWHTSLNSSHNRVYANVYTRAYAWIFTMGHGAQFSGVFYHAFAAKTTIKGSSSGSGAIFNI